MIKHFRIEPLSVMKLGAGFGAVMTDNDEFLPNWFKTEAECREFMKAPLMDHDWIEIRAPRKHASFIVFNGIRA